MSEHNCLEHIMSVEEAAKAWDMSPAKVKQLCFHNVVNAIKLGGKEHGTWVIYKDQPNPKKK